MAIHKTARKSFTSTETYRSSCRLRPQDIVKSRSRKAEAGCRELGISCVEPVSPISVAEEPEAAISHLAIKVTASETWSGGGTESFSCAICLSPIHLIYVRKSP